MAAALQSQVSNIADVFNAFAVPKLFAMNDFPGLVDPPKIVPSGIQTPSVSEVALMLRAMGLNISKDKSLLSYLWHILGFPALTDETFNEVYAQQGENNNKRVPAQHEDDGTAINVDDPDDSAQKLLEQNDQRYV